MKRTNESHLDNALLRLTLALVALVFIGSVGGEMIGAAFPGQAAPWHEAAAKIHVSQR
jgi:hypothetical protein